MLVDSYISVQSVVSISEQIFFFLFSLPPFSIQFSLAIDIFGVFILGPYFFFLIDYFLSSYGFIATLSRKLRVIPTDPTCALSPLPSALLMREVTFVIIEPTLTHHHHTKSIVYIRVHFWYCTSLGFRQMYNDMHPLLQYHTEFFHCPKDPLCTI